VGAATRGGLCNFATPTPAAQKRRQGSDESEIVKHKRMGTCIVCHVMHHGDATTQSIACNMEAFEQSILVFEL
jgi:hypothetical protein